MTQSDSALTGHVTERLVAATPAAGDIPTTAVAAADVALVAGNVSVASPVEISTAQKVWLPFTITMPKYTVAPVTVRMNITSNLNEILSGAAYWLGYDRKPFGRHNSRYNGRNNGRKRMVKNSSFRCNGRKSYFGRKATKSSPKELISAKRLPFGRYESFGPSQQFRPKLEFSFRWPFGFGRKGKNPFGRTLSSRSRFKHLVCPPVERVRPRC